MIINKELDYLKSLIAQIIERRRSLNMTQSALAKAAGFPQSYIARVESMQVNITVDNLLRIIDALGCEVVIRQKRRGSQRISASYDEQFKASELEKSRTRKYERNQK